MTFLRRVPLVPTVISLAVAITSGFAVRPVFDAANGADAAYAFLERPLGYVVLAPLSDVLDTLTLLSSAQHVALLAGATLLFVAWRVLKWSAGIRAHAVATAAFLAAIVLTYAAAMFLPRPMAMLVASDDDLVRIDFHSHTTASHDGHQSVQRLREWHRRAGYDVAYVTDHAAVSEAERGMADNPATASGGLVLLLGVEASWSGEHVSVPNAQRVYKGILSANLADIDTAGLRLAGFVPGREPVVIWNHPRKLDALPLAAGRGTMGVRAIEIVNGAPKDIGRLRAGRQEIVAMAQQRDLALVSGSDNHGFGWATPGWSVMLMPGWRGAAPDAIGLKIEQVIREGGFRATHVVERRVADPGASGVRTAASIVTVPYTMLTTLSNDERGWWLAWTWGVWLAVRFIRRRREIA